MPTSYYAAVVARVHARPIDDDGAKAALLRRQVARFQPEGGHAPIEDDAPPYGRMLGAIRGLQLDIRSVQAKFKFGGNKAPDHQRAIAEKLAIRNGPGDAAAREHQLRRLGRSWAAATAAAHALRAPAMTAHGSSSPIGRTSKRWAPDDCSAPGHGRPADRDRSPIRHTRNEGGGHQRVAASGVAASTTQLETCT